MNNEIKKNPKSQGDFGFFTMIINYSLMIFWVRIKALSSYTLIK